nr:MAG TPA: hypothetical protein [Caudoviricetes sp.]
MLALCWLNFVLCVVHIGMPPTTRLVMVGGGVTLGRYKGVTLSSSSGTSIHEESQKIRVKAIILLTRRPSSPPSPPGLWRHPPHAAAQRKGVRPVDTLGGMQQLTVINEGATLEMWPHHPDEDGVGTTEVIDNLGRRDERCPYFE